jgi:hypothetical protein
VQQCLDFVLITEHAHAQNELSKLLFIKKPVLVLIIPFETLVEFVKEPLMLLQLEVKNYFLKVLV